MTASADPTVQRLALRRRLRKARIESGSDRQQLAQALGWTLGDFMRVETLKAGIDDGRLLALLDHYGIADDVQVRELYGATRTASGTPAPMSKEVMLLLKYERAASAIRSFEPLLIPGLLQTREYAVAVLRLFAPPEDVDALVEARLARQNLLDRDDAPEAFFIIDESALHRWAGSAGAEKMIMRRQLARLRQVGRSQRVHIQIMPFRAGMHEGIKGPFVILEFADPSQYELLYLEDARGDFLGRVEPEDLQPYVERFWSLKSNAAPEQDLDRYVDRALEALNAEPES
ncbi:DUF5753 domain-containing protein [Actinoplanes sp. NPDC051513]|uniref:DUF5753 domain-containing protein n=1 Tax=Actinoplanes sp. NPDC051513 TaxID=3363908 RepID=UPI00378FCCA1